MKITQISEEQARRMFTDMPIWFRVKRENDYEHELDVDKLIGYLDARGYIKQSAVQECLMFVRNCNYYDQNVPGQVIEYTDNAIAELKQKIKELQEKLDERQTKDI